MDEKVFHLNEAKVAEMRIIEEASKNARLIRSAWYWFSKIRSYSILIIVSVVLSELASKDSRPLIFSLFHWLKSKWSPRILRGYLLLPPTHKGKKYFYIFLRMLIKNRFWTSRGRFLIELNKKWVLAGADWWKLESGK